MELKTKHRIIGIVVIVALAVIIVPLFFSRSNSVTNSSNLSAHVPNPPGKPDIEQIAIPVQPVGNSSKPTNVAPADDLATQPLQAAPTADNNTAPVDTKTASEEIATHINSATAAAAATAASANTPKPIMPAPSATTAAAASAPAEGEAANDAAPKSTTTPDAVDGQKTIAPPVNAAPIKNQQNNGDRNKSGVVKRRFAEESAPAPTAKHSLTPKIEAAKLKDAWTIQLGSFTEKKNAESLVKELRAKGYAAYIQEGKSENANVTRVYIGPELKRERADAMVKKLKETLNLKAVVVKYTV